MTKQLIVVVHGVGVREAGVATRRLSAGLVEGQQGGTAPWVLKSSDDLTLFENAVYNKGSLRKPFDAHKRRLERTEGDTTDHRIIADFYWGDISGTGSSVLRVIFGFFKLILGLAHAVRENAQSSFPDPNGWHRFLRWCAETAALTIHGPIFALNIMLIFGFGVASLPVAVTSLGLQTSGYPAETLARIVFALLSIIGGGIVLYLLRYSWLALQIGMAVFAAIVAVVANVTVLQNRGLFTSWIDRDTSFEATSIGIVVVASVVLGIALMKWGSVFLKRHLGGWLILCGLILALSLLSSLTETDPWRLIAKSDEAARQLNCAWTEGAIESCKASLSGYFVHGMRLTSLMILCWLIVLLAAVVLGIATYGFGLGPKPYPRRRSVTVPALALMSALWILVLGAVWGTLLRLVPAQATGCTCLADDPQPPEILVTSVMRALIPTFGVLVLVILVSGVIYFYQKRTFPPSYPPGDYLSPDADGNADSRAETGRLIFSVAALWVLVSFFLLVTGVIVISFAAAFLGSDWAMAIRGEIKVPEPDNSWIGLVPMTKIFIGFIAAIIAFSVALGAKFLARGIDIATDILTYINDYSWNSATVVATGADGASIFEGTATRTCLERLLRLRRDPPPPVQPQGYWQRRRIQNRLSLLVERLIVAERPEHLVLVSHSQGTVIAMDVIAKRGTHWRRRMNRLNTIKSRVGKSDATLGLVTMGSPYSHVYNWYFPESFAAHRQRVESKDDLGPVEAGGSLNFWRNIFRVDDFVGTHIDAVRNYAAVIDKPQFQWPEEKPVAVNGHTDYWTDKNVYLLVQERLIF